MRQRQLVCAREGLRHHQSRQRVQRRGQPKWPELDGPSNDRCPPGSIMVIVLRPVDALRHADTPVEPKQIGAAAEEHMLAVVDDLIHARMPIRRRPSAQVATALHKGDTQPGLAPARRPHSCRPRRRLPRLPSFPASAANRSPSPSPFARASPIIAETTRHRSRGNRPRQPFIKSNEPERLIVTLIRHKSFHTGCDQRRLSNWLVKCQRS